MFEGVLNTPQAWMFEGVLNTPQACFNAGN